MIQYFAIFIKNTFIHIMKKPGAISKAALAGAVQRLLYLTTPLLWRNVYLSGA